MPAGSAVPVGCRSRSSPRRAPRSALACAWSPRSPVSPAVVPCRVPEDGRGRRVTGPGTCYLREAACPKLTNPPCPSRGASPDSNRDVGPRNRRSAIEPQAGPGQVAERVWRRDGAERRISPSSVRRRPSAAPPSTDVRAEQAVERRTPTPYPPAIVGLHALDRRMVASSLTHSTRAQQLIARIERQRRSALKPDPRSPNHASSSSAHPMDTRTSGADD